MTAGDEMKILFAEDDRDIARAVTRLLEHGGYTVETVYNGTDALEYGEDGAYDGMILDWMMPGADGVTVLRKLRERGVTAPCLLLTARDAVGDRVEGLDAGADDYLPKPFDSGELLARVRAMLRRRDAGWVSDALRFGDLTLDRQGMTLRCGAEEVRLANKAFQLMELFMEHPQTVRSADQLMERVWGWDSEAEIQVVWVNISFLRKKLAEIGSRVEIRSSRGAGYFLAEGDAQP